MSDKKQKIIAIAAIIALIGLVLIWFYPLNKGTVVVAAGVTDYQIRFDGKEWIPCPADPCSAKIGTGAHNVDFQKEKYTSPVAQITVKRGKLSALTLKPKKIMEIRPANIVPQLPKDEEMPPLPPGLSADNILASVWNATKDKFLYLDKADNRLKIMDATGKTSPVTVLAGIAPPLGLIWSPDEKKVIGGNGRDLYFINIEEGARKKEALEFEPLNLMWSPGNGYLVLNGGKDGLYRLDWDARQTTALEKEIPLAQSTWLDADTLLYFTMGEGSRASIQTYDIANNAQESLIDKYDFPLDAVTYDKEAKKAYFHNTQHGGWFEMEM